MSINQGENVTTSYEGMGYAFDKVVFQAGKTLLDSELNLSQELQEVLTQKSTAHLPSGWLSYRPIYTSNDLGNAFYTQDPTGAKPEVALVNGWPIYVTNTNTPLRHVNKVDFSDNILRSGSRVDGVYIEVWRSVIAPQEESVALQSNVKPQPVSKLSDIHSVWMYNEDLGWAVGENGTILKTLDGGNSWLSVDTPVNTTFKKVKFYNDSVGYAISDKGNIIKTLDGGESWFTLEVSTNDGLNDLYIIDDKKVCVVGNNGLILLAIDGTNFELVSQTAGNTNSLNGVCFFDLSVGWTVGDEGTLLMTKDGGSIWQKYSMTDSSTGLAVTENLKSVAFYNLNDGVVVGANGVIFRTSDSGFTWANMSGRIWYGGAYKTIQEIFPNETIDFNRVFIKQDFPIKLIIGVYPDSRNYFKNLIYRISPMDYPNSLVLEFTGAQDGINYIKVLDLSSYATTELLSIAINDLTNAYRAEDAALPDDQRQKVRVFESSVAYTAFSKPSDFRPSSGSFSSLNPAQLSFSVENKAWIAADSGVALQSNNSGSKWEIVDLGVGYDLYDLFYTSDTVGWYVGSEGSIVIYDGGVATEQSTDLITKVQGRIFPEGNVLSQAAEYLKDNIIDPQVGVETTKRVQIQYRIRIASGIDAFNYPEAGLGHSFVHSQGPNLTEGDAGDYSYENMGQENGDYGLWRARCRNTYDGYSWAVPMFFVTRRNSASFDVDSNINGSTYYELNAIRPDGLTYEQIVDDDIVDIRRMVVVQSYSYLLEKNIEKLLSNNLKTNISDRDQRGLQYGTSILMADQYTGTSDIADLVTGGVSSAAVIVEDQKTLDPNIVITEAELTFGPRDNGLYHNDPSYYSAYVVRDGTPTSEPVTGTFEGYGTNKVIFHIADNFTPAGGTLEGVTYQITTHYIDYSRDGLERVPQRPVSIKYQADPVDTNQTYYFNGVNSRDISRLLEYLPENVAGYPDYVEVHSAVKLLDNVNDETLYELIGHTDSLGADYQKSLRKYRGQQFRGTMVEYHHYMKVDAATNVLRIPKNINGYSAYGVRYVHNVAGAAYKISIDYQADLSMRDREKVDSTVVRDNLIVYLDEAFTIPAGATIHVLLDAMVPMDFEPSPTTTPRENLGITVRSRGENQEALRTSLTANYNIASRAIGGMYAGMLYPITITGLTTTVLVDLTAEPDDSFLRDGIILGISSCETKETTRQSYVWYMSGNPPDDEKFYTMVPVQSMTGLGTGTVVMTIDPRHTVTTGWLLVPLLVQLNRLPGPPIDTSVATVFYKSVPYQTVGGLPAEMTLEVVKTSDFVFITNLGTGASDIIKGEPYATPAEQIPVNDTTVSNDNIFSNIDDIDLNNFSVDTGFIRLPGILSQYVGEDITLSQPNNIGDKLGRPFYTVCSQSIIAQAESLTLGCTRKVFIPMIARVRSDILKPVVRGELVLVIFSKVYKARTENKTGYFEDEGTEYLPGYFEYADTAISIYKLTNKPLARK